MNKGTAHSAGQPLATTEEQLVQPRRRGVLVIGFFPMRAPRPKPPRVYRARRPRPVQFDLFPETSTEERRPRRVRPRP
ncbi:hypothetical protein [Azospirillum sp. B2RO_4]|uniref:hypothetical protein n=1 Tax=Azospirillum sp. B2RO_4 TaxID=3027796 RepID=UPI003DA997D7